MERPFKAKCTRACVCVCVGGCVCYLGGIIVAVLCGELYGFKHILPSNQALSAHIKCWITFNVLT